LQGFLVEKTGTRKKPASGIKQEADFWQNLIDLLKPGIFTILRIACYSVVKDVAERLTHRREAL